MIFESIGTNSQYSLAPFKIIVLELFLLFKLSYNSNLTPHNHFKSFSTKILSALKPESGAIANAAETIDAPISFLI
ncbi:hypothetical protein J6V86_02155 [bacterium]|nr:hypothetical protein [bacterium]